MKKSAISKLSTGQDNTLESWINLSSAIFGQDSKATLFLKEKAKHAKNGVKEEIIADETQLLSVLVSIINIETKLATLYPFEMSSGREYFLIEKQHCLIDVVLDYWNNNEALIHSNGSCIFDSSLSIQDNDESLRRYGIGIKQINNVYCLYDCLTDEIFIHQSQKLH